MSGAASVSYSPAALRAARRYAEAVLELALEQGGAGAEPAAVLATVGAQLQDVAMMWAESAELRDTLQDAALDEETRRRVLRGLGERAGLAPYLVSTLCLLGDRGRLPLLGALSESFFALAEERSGLLRAEVTTATSLPAAYYDRLQKVLEDVTGKRIVMARKEDPSLLAGVVTRIGDKVFDGSLKRRFETLSGHLDEVDTTGLASAS